MDDLVKNLSSVAWWVGVVVVGIVLNLASAYAKRPIDSLMSAISSRWQRRSERSRAAREARVAELRADEQLRTLLLADEMREGVKSIKCLLIVVISMLMYISTNASSPASWFIPFQLLLSASFVILAARSEIRVQSYKALLSDALKK